MSDFLSGINPFYKFVAVLLFSVSVAFTKSMWINVGVFSACIVLLLVGSRPRRWLGGVKFLIPAAFFAFSIFMSGAYFGNHSPSNFGIANLSAVRAGLNLSTRFLAFAWLGILFSITTDPYELVKSLRKNAGLPRKFAYGMLCAINLFPYIRNEYLNAKLAFRVRGIRVGFFSTKPIFSMLVNCFRWSEALSMAMQSKGFYEE
ncbi:MAG: energy-coupling factor transporter transmembrane protein EcfT [Treponema sp.]|nr:energy-coupling factor transporter transmembrane protein EcfT [Treponema sp.]